MALLPACWSTPDPAAAHWEQDSAELLSRSSAHQHSPDLLPTAATNLTKHCHTLCVGCRRSPLPYFPHPHFLARSPLPCHFYTAGKIRAHNSKPKLESSSLSQCVRVSGYAVGQREISPLHEQLCYGIWCVTGERQFLLLRTVWNYPKISSKYQYCPEHLQEMSCSRPL